ncbi:hypothetical protein CFC21_087805 [Triticum aestivum]|uniref:Exopolygalacturonase n=2 Tax=Triticum aestivum TaxID=4565 RepID=A0A9R1IIV9_WHEAT|nr:exopolygalacturonase-like [Triticum aestivum]KAF7084121.1 hypothetical protein CFC21_087805 [Triticum aestivum]
MVTAGRSNAAAPAVAVAVALCAALLGSTAWALPPYQPLPLPKPPGGGAPSLPAGPLDIVMLGAKGDGKTDATQAVMKAWKNACGATGTQKIVIPPGNFLVGALELSGPCTSSIIIRLDGNLLGTGDLTAYKKNWIEVMRVDNFAINGHGVIDGQGPLVWEKNMCSKHYDCKILPNSLVLDYVNNATIRGITLKNAKFFHLNLFNCKNVLVENVEITAPGNSPNTDGIHMGDSEDVTIKATNIGVGDDCISIGPGTKHVKIHGSRCGPGHGISVGSLGRYKDEKDVEDIQVTNCTIKGATNGLRIKSYEDSKSAIRATRFVYDNVKMDNVSYPIVIDQKYCPNNICAKAPGASKVVVADIVFKNIVGTSATPEAVTLNCVNNVPCQGLQLVNVNLKYTGTNNKTMAVCKNAVGTSVNVVKELACL